MATPTPTLRQQLKQETRQRLEQAALRLLAKQGYQNTTIGQIVDAAGTTRTTFYDHFVAKSDLIHVVQEREIAPALVRLCQRLDAHDPITRAHFRGWLDDYARTWQRIRVYFDAYSEASRTDHAVGKTILPNSYQVTGHMRRFLARVPAARRATAHDQLVLLFNDLDQHMHVTNLMHDPADARRMREALVDLYWHGLFELAVTAPRRASGRRNRNTKRRTSGSAN
jgi:AcrR family transcriptional regulator